MNYKTIVVGLTVGLLMFGCANPTPGLKHGVAENTPAGWTKADLPGLTYGFSTPSDMKSQLAPPEVMANAMKGVAGSEVLKSIVICTSTKVPPDSVAVFEEAVMKTDGQIDGFMKGFTGSLIKQGILTDKLKETKTTTPIGEARVVRGPGMIAGQKSQTTIYVWPDKNVVYTMMVSGLGHDPDSTATKMAETFRVK